MRPASDRTALSAVAVALSLLAVAVSAAEEPRVVIALDSSRSLSAAESRTAARLASDLYARLAATTRPSVLTFDDSVRWLARPGEPGAEALLDALRPAGRFTVLHDGLIAAARSLDAGGVLVVISDGKDENSATTLEDFARLASERGVRVVTLGAGRVDERTMKRLALLTGGLYVGMTADADADALTAEIEALRREVAAERTPPAAPLPPAAAAPAPAIETPVEAPAATPARELSRSLLLALALVAVMGIALGFLIARRRAPAAPAESHEPDAGTKPGVAVPEAPATHAAEPEAPAIDEIELARLRARPRLPAGGLAEVSLDDTAAFRSLPFSESIERTIVLTEEVVLTVREPGQEMRSYRLPPGRAVDVGRAAQGNTLAFQDPTMSLQHFRLVLDDGEVFLVDLGSTNGVLLAGRRVASARLQPGDRFRAGMIEFGLNLHRASTS
jgi:hypothetical protein